MSPMTTGFAFLLLTAITPFCLADGFSGGSELTATPVSGEATVQCQNGESSKQQTFQCYDLILLPNEYDVFMGPKGTGADQVTLAATRPDGSTKSKGVAYDSNLGQSTAKVNLWVRTLLQAPLLQEGVNQVSYSLTKAGQEVGKGQFAVTIKRGRSLRCSQRSVYQSTDMNDCDNQPKICDRFLTENNYCVSPAR